MGEQIEIYRRNDLTTPQLVARYLLAQVNCEAAIAEMHLCMELLERLDPTPTFEDAS